MAYLAYGIETNSVPDVRRKFYCSTLAYSINKLQSQFFTERNYALIDDIFNITYQNKQRLIKVGPFLRT